MAKNMKKSVKIKKYMKRCGIELNPIIIEVLEEYDRLDNIRQKLYDEIEDKEVLEIYINKSGNSNEVITAAIKEYKSYTLQFNNLTKTLQGIIDNKSSGDTNEDDPFRKLIKK
jgi:hypothetical protein